MNILVWLFLLLASHLAADGCFVGPPKVYVQEPGQTALLCHENGKETLVLQVVYEGATEDFAWIVPLPSVPKVSLVPQKANPFPALSRLAWSRDRLAGARAPEEPPVQVITPEFTLGNYTVVVLKSGKAETLETWLNAHGFHIPDASRPVLKYYVDLGWTFTAMRLRIQGHRRGELQALRFEFNTEKAVYPLHISSVNPGLTQVHLYVLSPKPVQLTEPDHWPRFDSVHAYKTFPTLFTATSIELLSLAQIENMLVQHEGLPGHKELDGVYALLGLTPSAQLSLGEYRAVLSPLEMDRDLWFDPLSAIAFWELAAKSGDDHLRRSALVMLTALDPGRASEAVAGGDPLLTCVAIKFQGDHLSQDQLRKLAKGAQGQVRRALVLCPQTPPDALLKVDYTGSKDPLLFLVASRPDLRPDHIRTLARRYPTLMTALYDHPHFPKDLLFSGPLEPSLKFKIANNPAATKRELTLLFRETDPNLVATLLCNPGMDEDLFAQWRAVAGAEACSDAAEFIALAGVQRKLLEEDARTRCMLARNPKLCRDVAETLFKDPLAVRCLAENPTLDANLLDKLLRLPDSQIGWALAQNYALNTSQIDLLAKSRDESTRSSVAVHAKLSQATLQRLLADPSPRVRMNAHLNRDITRQQLEQHLKDPDLEVRQHAERVLKSRFGDVQP